MKRFMKGLGIFVAIFIFSLAGCSSASVVSDQTKLVSDVTNSADSNHKTIISFADVGWDSIRFHNAVAMFIIEKAFGYDTEEIGGTTPIIYPALKEGEIDVLMEMWTDNVPTYKEDIKNGDLLELSTNFDDDSQGLYVPRYVIEGDSVRGIEAVAPDLKTVKDLLKYSDVFADPEEPGMGRIYGAISGWNIDTVLNKKFFEYGLNSCYTYFSPGSDAALSAAFTSAYEKGKPIVGYYWEPTWLTGKYDLVRLTDDPYDAVHFNEGIGDFPAVRVTVCSSTQLLTKAPEVAGFLKKYKTSTQLTSEALAYMYDNSADYETTAKWFLKENSDLWTAWLTDKQVSLVKAALE